MHKLPLGEIPDSTTHPQWNQARNSEGTVAAFTKYLSAWDKQDLVKGHWKKDLEIVVVDCISRELGYCGHGAGRWLSLPEPADAVMAPLHLVALDQTGLLEHIVTLLMNRLLWLQIKRKDPSLAQSLPPWAGTFPAWLYWIEPSWSWEGWLSTPDTKYTSAVLPQHMGLLRVRVSDLPLILPATSVEDKTPSVLLVYKNLTRSNCGSQGICGWGLDSRHSHWDSAVTVAQWQPGDGVCVLWWRLFKAAP